jgi:hypothetical protein
MKGSIMERTSQLGTNRTGMKTSPADAGRLLEGVEKLSPAPANGAQLGLAAHAAIRTDYIRESDRLGSVPPPASAKGALKSGIEIVKGKRPQLILDKIAERLAFERTGTRLYEALLIKHEASGPVTEVPLAKLEQFHNEEAQHFRMLIEAMESFGGDPTAQTPNADVTAVAGMGWLQVASDPRTSFVQTLHAVHLAELADVDGWELLVTLMQKSGHSDLAQRFSAAHQQEEIHLDHVRRWMSELTLAEAGRAVTS